LISAEARFAYRHLLSLLSASLAHSSACIAPYPQSSVRKSKRWAWQ